MISINSHRWLLYIKFFNVNVEHAEKFLSVCFSGCSSSLTFVLEKHFKIFSDWPQDNVEPGEGGVSEWKEQESVLVKLWQTHIKEQIFPWVKFGILTLYRCVTHRINWSVWSECWGTQQKFHDLEKIILLRSGKRAHHRCRGWPGRGTVRVEEKNCVPICWSWSKEHTFLTKLAM